MTDDPHKTTHRALRAGVSVGLIVISVALTATLLHRPAAPVASPRAIGDAGTGVSALVAPKAVRPAALVIPAKKKAKRKVVTQTAASTTAVANTNTAATTRAQTATVTPTRTATATKTTVKKKSTAVPADTEFGPG